jgi:hypothetical protein
VSVDYSQGVTDRDPIGKTMSEALIAAHPDWTDGQVAERLNREYTTPVIDVAEVAHWRAEVAR